MAKDGSDLIPLTAQQVLEGLEGCAMIQKYNRKLVLNDEGKDLKFLERLENGDHVLRVKGIKCTEKIEIDKPFWYPLIIEGCEFEEINLIGIEYEIIKRTNNKV